MRWMDDEEETESYLVMCTEFNHQDGTTMPVYTSSFDYSGYEVKSMIYVYRYCPDCETGRIRTNLITRAKSSLVAIQLRVPCMVCVDKKNPVTVKKKSRLKKLPKEKIDQYLAYYEKYA